MSYRIPLQDLASSDEGQFGIRWEARIPVPIKEIEADLASAFHSRYDGFKPGDQVTVCAFDPMNGQWRDNGILREVATYRIVKRADRKITAVRIGDVFTVPAATPNGKAIVAADLSVAEVNGGFEVRDGKGNVVEQFVDRNQAEEFRDREAARPFHGLKVKRAFGGKFQVVDSGGDVVREFSKKDEAEAFAGA